MKIKVNPTADRRRGGISFRARQKQIIDTDALELNDDQVAVIMADPILRAKEVDDDGDVIDGGDDTVVDGVIAELSEREKANRLAQLVLMASQMPTVDGVLSVLGFEVSDQQIADAWDAAGKADQLSDEDRAEAFATFMRKAYEADPTKLPTVGPTKSELGFKVSGEEIKTAWKSLQEENSAS